ncbi:hypothetical protein AAVH_03943 [Aphelenchoides avenae]|nr:hypothetical protein AAVH_03943 [Aphelenchus avenae]
MLQHSCLVQTCDNGIGTIRQVLNAQRRPDPSLSTVLKQLCRERNTYDLLLKQMDADAAAEEEKEPSSHLQKLFAEDPEFRRLLTLLRWSEEMESEQPGSFKKACDDITAFDDTKNIL